MHLHRMNKLRTISHLCRPLDIRIILPARQMRPGRRPVLAGRRLVCLRVKRSDRPASLFLVDRALEDGIEIVTV